MTAVQKIDSNVSGLRYSEETSLGVANGSAVWNPLEPNTYTKFGADIKTVARNPINASRQRQKGVTTDLDATGGFNTDLTQTNLQDILQGFFFADLRRKGEAVPTSINGANAFLVAATAGFQIGDLVFATGFGTAANNGLHPVSAVVANTSITTSDTLTAETPPTGNNLVNVGHKFGSALLNVVATSSLPTIVNVGAQATGTFTISVGDVSDGDTVVIGSKTYTFQSALTNVDGHVHVGGTITQSATNLFNAINGTGGTPGTDYAAATVANTQVTATNPSSGVVDVTAILHSVSGNAIVTTTTASHGAWGGGTLTGGTGVSFTELGLIPGEWVYIGGDAASTSFVNAVNNGWARIRSIADTVLTLDKTSGVMINETGTGLTIEMFFGRVLKNESDPTLIKRRSYQLERTLGAPDSSSPTQIQSEYIIGSVGNTAKFNYAGQNKVTVDLDFIGIDRESRSGVTGVKSGTRPAIVSANAFNTSSDFARLKMAILDPANSDPTSLFAFVTTFDVSLSNGVTPDKAISKLGAFDVTAGQFVIDGSATAYFADVASVDAARNNSDVTLDYIVVKNNTVGTLTVAQGILMDVPLLSLAGASANVVQDKPIELPLTMAAGADRNFNHTLLMEWYDYLPAVAHP